MTRQSKNPPLSRLDTLLSAHGLTPQDWDLVLCGDGSGSGWKTGGAYAVFLVDQCMPARDFLTGGCSHTTVNRMELSAYTEALAYHYHGLLEGSLKKIPYNVWIFTDSEITAKVGEGVYARKANADLWHTIDWYESRGYRLNWRNIPRNSTDFHVEADDIAGEMRAGIIKCAHTNSDGDTRTDILDLMPYDHGQLSTLITCSRCRTPMQGILTTCPICGEERTVDV